MIRALRRSAGKAVWVAAGPIFTARRLMPEIGNFRTAHPDIELEVIPSCQPGMRGRTDPG